MSNLIVITYPEPNKAAEVLDKLLELQKEYLVDLEDAAYAVKDGSGKVKLHQMYNVTGASAAGGAMWGLLFGALFFVPIAGMAVGAATGALAGKASDYGIDDKFIKQLSEQMTPNSSALFVLVRHSTPEKVIPEVSKFGGTLIQTSLSKETEDKLRSALENSSQA
jgi:uncharacterized membrane protein